MNPIFVITAAGRSLRMGEPKVSLKLHSKFWLVYQIEQIRKILPNACIKIVVNPSQFEITQQIIEMIESVEVLQNSDQNSEPWQSILISLKQCKNQSAIIHPVDIPIDGSVLTLILNKAKFVSEKYVSIKPIFSSSGGHPVWLSQKLTHEFILKPERLDYFIRKWPQELIHVNSALVIKNLNYPEQWSEFLDSCKESKNEIY